MVVVSAVTVLVSVAEAEVSVVVVVAAEVAGGVVDADTVAR